MAINYDAPIVIRDFRNGDWFWISKYVWNDKRLSSSDKIIYGTIAFFANQNQRSWPSIKTMAEFSDVSERQTYSSIKKLCVLDYLYIKRGGGRGRSNEYQLLKVNTATITPFLKNPALVATNPAKSTVKPCKIVGTNNKHITINKEQEHLNKLKLNELRTSLKGKGIVKK